MNLLTKIGVFIIALEHIYILYMEMFAWMTLGKKTFKNIPKDLFETTRTMAANQGLYNGFLAAGLLWSLVINDNMWSNNIAQFFLVCIILAGIYGSFSVSKRIFWLQAFPAILVLISFLL